MTDVADGCAASDLLIKGDKVVSIHGTTVTDEVQGRALAKAAVGEVAFSVRRGNECLTVTGTRHLAITLLLFHPHARPISPHHLQTPPSPHPHPHSHSVASRPRHHSRQA